MFNLNYKKCLLIVFIFLPVSVSAVDETELNNCSSIMEDETRLLCFDQLTDQNQRTSLTTDNLIQIENLIKKHQFFDAQEKLVQFMSQLTPEEKNSIEIMTLSSVRPIPSSERKKNLQGYNLLSFLNTKNEQYLSKIKIYSDEDTSQKQISDLDKLRLEVDDFTKKQVYYHPLDPTYVNEGSRISLTLNRYQDGQVNLGLRTIYVASNWLWVDRVDVLVDGVSYQLTSGEFNRDNDQNVWEWRLEKPTPNQIFILEQIANGKVVKIRYYGDDFYDDRTLKSSYRQSIREVLLIHQNLENERKVTLKTDVTEDYVPQRITRTVGSKPMRCFDPKRKIVYSHSPYSMSCSSDDYPISDDDFFKLN